MAYTNKTIEQLLDHTYPQLLIIYSNRGRFVYPQLKPILEYTFAKSFPNDKEVNAYVAAKEKELRLIKADITVPLTTKEVTRKRAWDFFVAEYRGLPQDVYVPESPKAKILEIPISASAARGIISWIKQNGGSDVPNDVWINDLMRIYPSILAVLEKEKK